MEGGGLMMREGAKHRVGCIMREEKTQELQRRGGMDMVGRLEEGLDRQRERGQKKKRRVGVVMLVVGVQVMSSQHSQLEQTNGRETDSIVSNGREEEEERSSLCLGCFPAPFIF